MNRRAGGSEGAGAQERRDRFGGHFGSTNSSTSPEVTNISSDLPAPTDGASSTIFMPKRRVSRRDLMAVASSLGERHWEVLKSVAAHRFLTVDQIRRLHFWELGPRRAQKALQRLRDDRILSSLDRRIGGVKNGSSGLVHYVDVVGYRLLQLEDSMPARRHVKEPSETFLQHTLDVAETHCRLVEADRRGELELVYYELEPAAWRRYPGLSGAIVYVKPDLYVETTTVRGSDDIESFFIEIDLGTESIPRLIKKCHDYQKYERRGIEQGDADDTQEFPAVVWTMTHRNIATAERRRRALARAIEHERKLDPELFHVTSPDQLINLITKGGDL